MQRRIVLVSGAPGTGKTTLAVPLAAALGFPLFSKDDIKETLWDALAPPSADLVWSRRIGGAAMEVLWKLASRSSSAVLEANFRPNSSLELGRLAALNAAVIEVYCRCSPAEAVRRYNSRGPTRHPAHVRATLTAHALREFDRPMSVGPVIEVDTEAPVDLEHITAWIRDGLHA